MNIHSSVQRQTIKFYGWIVVFFFILFTVGWLFYYAVQKTGYDWSRHEIFPYLTYQEKVEITAGIAGDVDAIHLNGTQAVIEIKNLTVSKSYKVPAQNIQVNEGESISVGDTLATCKKWKPGILVHGGMITLKIGFVAGMMGIFIGFWLGLARVAENPALKLTSFAYMEIIRCCPLLVQILIWYFVFGTVANQILVQNGLPEIRPLWFGLVSLACYHGAYVADIFKSTVRSIHPGQWETAKALGMNHAQSLIHVIIPQAIRKMLPEIAGRFISVIKDSCLLSIIAVPELTHITKQIPDSEHMFELWFTCALAYLLITLTLSLFVRYLERRRRLS